MNNSILWLKDEESGQGLVEYGLIIALVAVVCIVGLTAMGGQLNGMFNFLKEKIQFS